MPRPAAKPLRRIARQVSVILAVAIGTTGCGGHSSNGSSSPTSSPPAKAATSTTTAPAATTTSTTASTSTTTIPPTTTTTAPLAHPGQVTVAQERATAQAMLFTPAMFPASEDWKASPASSAGGPTECGFSGAKPAAFADSKTFTNTQTEVTALDAVQFLPTAADEKRDIQATYAPTFPNCLQKALGATDASTTSTTQLSDGPTHFQGNYIAFIVTGTANGIPVQADVVFAFEGRAELAMVIGGPGDDSSLLNLAAGQNLGIVLQRDHQPAR